MVWWPQENAENKKALENISLDTCRNEKMRYAVDVDAVSYTHLMKSRQVRYDAHVFPHFVQVISWTWTHKRPRETNTGNEYNNQDVINTL